MPTTPPGLRRGLMEEYPDFPGKAGEYLQWIDRELLPGPPGALAHLRPAGGCGDPGILAGGLLASYCTLVSLTSAMP